MPAVGERYRTVSFSPGQKQLRLLYQALLASYGPQDWWPGDSPFEVMVGAVLTQNTAWSNVEQAIGNLKAAGVLSPQRILALGDSQLGELLRPSGYFNIKTARLRNLCRYLQAAGGERVLRKKETSVLRQELLAVNGVGPETADSILLYAFDRPVFVIDAYTRRLLLRFQLAAGDEGYEELRQGFEEALGPDAGLFNEYHALIVQHAKAVCAVRPRCVDCDLAGLCPSRNSRPSSNK